MKIKGLEYILCPQPMFVLYQCMDPISLYLSNLKNDKFNYDLLIIYVNTYYSFINFII